MLAFAPLAARADHADQAQCTCEPEGEHLTGITNGSLCVLTPGGGDPTCNVHVLCLSDGTGPDCRPHAAAIEAADEALAGGSFDLREFASTLESAVANQTPQLFSSAHGDGLSWALSLTMEGLRSR